ncbi:DUF2145 domain-containing protein [Ponticaulis sp.]|uniref:DUF2145 domain-containing protein n=1 Tax=Ponticaulis sp. TaxID=2020902 RepID=UPI000B74A9E9|nr:DUF2145 domain-containing protein [Ponticaulis sp.]OUY00762.1 MAG: hypothetical protein CBB65_04860 [Hyphomonadaceae bacterium TMED5]|tara:strand:+ start:36569 stop:37390 length:822 start_codon:yes stop_codon:yes gene_type:complete
MGGHAGIPAALAAIAVMTAPSAFAFDSTAQSSPVFLTVEEAADFSKQIEDSLAQNGARVAMVFRSGRDRDRLPDNVQYTHGAFWVYQDIAREDGSVMRGYAVYNLYHGDGEEMPRTTSYLLQDFPFDFTEASAVDDVAVIIPEPELQRRILNVMASPAYEELHIPDYSLISNASDPEFQNCNEFMLDVIAAAAWQTTDYTQIKANLAAHFEPTEIDVNFFERLFAPMADERLQTDDHRGAIETVTYSSLANFLREYSMLQATYILERDPSLRS